MKNELLLIIGPPASGKTWLAAACQEALDPCGEGEAAAIVESPDLTSSYVMRQIKSMNCHVIVVCNLVTSQQLQELAPDRVYSIGLKITR